MQSAAVFTGPQNANGENITQRLTDADSNTNVVFLESVIKFASFAVGGIPEAECTETAALHAHTDTGD